MNEVQASENLQNSNRCVFSDCMAWFDPELGGKSGLTGWRWTDKREDPELPVHDHRTAQQDQELREQHAQAALESSLVDQGGERVRGGVLFSKERPGYG